MPHPVEELQCPTTYARILHQQSPGHSLELLRNTGLEANSLGRREYIKVAQLIQVFRNALALEHNVGWGLKLGRRLNFSGHGALGFAALSAPTIGDGLDVYTKYARSRAPYIDLIGQRSGGYYRLLVDSTMPLAKLEEPLAEVLLLIAEAYVMEVLGSVPDQSTLSFAFPRPAHGQLYAEYFSLPVQFDAAETCLQIPLELCEMPCPLYDEQAYQAALARCRIELSAVIDPGDAASRVRLLLASHFDQVDLVEDIVAPPNLDTVASTLCISPRTLIRQLTTQNTSFRQMLEELQLAAASRLLDQARYSVADISALLGYSDTSNFNRAFRRWTGLSPGRYRRRIR